MQKVETVFFGPMLGELGWALSRWHGYCRLRRFVEFKNLRSMAMDYDWRYPIYADFVDDFVPLPKWVSELGWEQDCYELVPPEAHPGSVTPPEVYAQLLAESATHYDPNTTWTVRPPRGCNLFISERCRQMWKTLEPSKEAQAYADSLLYNAHGNIVVVSARGRSRAANRNVPEFVWNKLVDYLVQHGFVVVITGTRHSSFLVNKVGRNIINVIPQIGASGLDITIALMRRAKFTVTSQSGPTHIALQCEIPSYIVGHESYRHSVVENYLNAPAMFRTAPEHVYAALTPEIMLEDILGFNQQLIGAENAVEESYKACYMRDKSIMHDFIYNPRLDLYQVDIQKMRKELLNVV